MAMSFQPAGAQAVFSRLSVERMAPYLAAGAGDPVRAVALHAWNTLASGVFYENLQVAEVVLRNALHDQLTTWHQATGGDGRWYLALPQSLTNRGLPLLTSQAIADLQQARRRAVRDGKRETPGRVVAELNFGFWRYLLSRRYEHTLWTPVLRRAFPNATLARATVEEDVAQLHYLRNRLAHHEPIFLRDLHLDQARILRVIGWVCTETQSWVASASRFRNILALKP